MAEISDQLWDEIDLVINRRGRLAQLSAEEQRCAEGRLTKFLASENIEEEDDPYEGDDDAEEDYIPPEEATSDSQEELAIEANVVTDSDDDEEGEAGLTAAGEYYTSKADIMWMKNPPPRYRPHAHNHPYSGDH
ncbi:hypothetical protein RI129_002851 [Pyrocoelia pectoralis]|uniref:Uncharacterized protein n=1 Tax=Pyrocoelia pectoralis TaxID=417401 RepID=A0AAN7VQG7_9COLE